MNWVPLADVPSKDDKKVLAFCKRLSPNHQPFYVPVRPEEGFEPLMCFPNVTEKVKRAGGSIVYGWEISQRPKIHLEAQFHSVWKSPSGEFVDVTPQLMPQSPILFLIDDHRVYNGEIVRDQRFALGDPKLVSRYWELYDRQMSILSELQVAGFPPGHPVYRERLGAIRAEAQAICSELERS